MLPVIVFKTMISCTTLCLLVCQRRFKHNWNNNRTQYGEVFDVACRKGTNTQTVHHSCIFH